MKTEGFEFKRTETSDIESKYGYNIILNSVGGVSLKNGHKYMVNGSAYGFPIDPPEKLGKDLLKKISTLMNNRGYIIKEYIILYRSNKQFIAFFVGEKNGKYKIFREQYKQMLDVCDIELINIDKEDKINEIIEKQNELVDKPSYSIHVLANNIPDYISGEESNEWIDNACNIYTHGLYQTKNHPEFRITTDVLGIKMTVALMNKICEDVINNTDYLTAMLDFSSFAKEQFIYVPVCSDIVEVNFIHDIDQPNMIRIIIFGSKFSKLIDPDVMLNQFKHIGILKEKQKEV